MMSTKERSLLHESSPVVIHSRGSLNRGIYEMSKEAFRARGAEVGEALAAAWLVPEEKLEKVIDYAMKTLAHNGHWKADKIARKTAEYFKLKPAPPKAEEDDEA